MALNPSDPLVLSGAVPDEDLNETISVQRRIVAIDPLSPINRGNLGIFLMAVGQWEEAKAEFIKALELSPTRLDFQTEVAKILILQRRFDEAINLALQLPEGHLRDQCFALVHHATGNTAAAATALAHLIALAETPNSDATVKLAIAEVYAFRRDGDQAFKWLAMAGEQTRDDRVVVPGWWIKQELPLSAFLKPLHADPRWETLLASAERS
jgi:tetratricopeptide (TPR) repeat protein